jgi:hypothetical protein
MVSSRRYDALTWVEGGPALSGRPGLRVGSGRFDSLRSLNRRQLKLTTFNPSTMVDGVSDDIRMAIGTAQGREPLPELRRLQALHADLARAEAEQVRRARAEGYSWVAIAGALGVSRQAVHKKFGRR